LADIGGDGRIILKWIFTKRDGSMDWVNRAQDRGRWPALVNEPSVSIKLKKFLN